MRVTSGNRPRWFSPGRVSYLVRPARFFLLSLLLMGFPSTPGAAQERRPEPTLNAGFSTAKPGDPVDIPLTLSGAEQPQMGSIRAELTYPKNALTFVRAEAGLASELAEADVRGTIQDSSDEPNLSVLTVSISPKRPQRPGILLYLKFRVPTDSKKGRVLLKVRSVQATRLDGAPLALAKGKDGTVEVFDRDEQIPQVGCFFFTH